MTTVTQGSSLSQIATDPLRNFKFRVVLNPPGSTSTAAAPAIGFMSVSGLNVTVDVIAYREGGYNPTALPLDTPILTVEGWKPNREMEVGDRVIDPYGEESKVVGIYPAGKKEVYKVTTGDGTEAIACYGHLWEVEVAVWGYMTRKIVTTLELKELIEKGTFVLLPKMTPAKFDALGELPIDPYLMGILLAEGSLEKEGVSFAQDPDNIEVMNRVRAALPEGHYLNSRRVAGKGWKHRITIGQKGRANKDANLVLKAMRDLGLTGHRAWEKFIPDVYKFATIQDRIDLLRGYMDGDGSISKWNIRVSSASEQLNKDVTFIVNSLGGYCRSRKVTDKTYMYKGERRKCHDEYRITSMHIPVNPFFMPKKAIRWTEPRSNLQFRKVIDVQYVGKDDVQCLEVSADSHLFVTQGIHGGYSLSHNTQKLPGQADFSPITLSKGVALGQTYDIDWLRQIFTAIQGTGTAASGSDFRYTVDIQVLDFPNETTSAIVKAWFRVYKAWPTSIAWSDLDAGANQLFISQLSLAHEGFDFSIATSAGSTNAGSSQANNPQTGTA